MSYHYTEDDLTDEQIAYAHDLANFYINREITKEQAQKKCVSDEQYQYFLDLI